VNPAAGRGLAAAHADVADQGAAAAVKPSVEAAAVAERNLRRGNNVITDS
jgi:hypothetical protein